MPGFSANSPSGAKANNQREPTRGFTTFPSVAGNFPVASRPLVTALTFRSASRPERSEAVRNPDAEANLVPEAVPGLRQSSKGVAQFKRHQHCLKRRFSTGSGSLKTTITPSPAFASSAPYSAALALHALRGDRRASRSNQRYHSNVQGGGRTQSESKITKQRNRLYGFST
jgi:hypothetical protein